MQENRILVTVNGVPVAQVIDEEIREEITIHRESEIKSMGFVKRLHIPTTAFRNHSGSRTSRGRIIYSRAAMGGI